MTYVQKTIPACISASNDESTKFHDLNSDVLSRIFEEVIIQNRDEIAIFKTKYNKFIQGNGYGDFENGVYDFIKTGVSVWDMEDEVIDWIRDYIKNLSQNQINVILCDYGINKALKLMYDISKKFEMGDDEDFCEKLLSNPSDTQMVELIFRDEIQFFIGWNEVEQ